MANGVSGNIATLYPPFSPMLWTSIATGKRPGKHGIHGFIEPTPDGKGVRPITALSRQRQSRLEHPQPEWQTLHCHRLVALASRRTPQRRHSLQLLPQGR